MTPAETMLERLSPRRTADHGVILAVVMVLLGVLLLWWGALFAYAQVISRLSAGEVARRQACWSARSGALHGLLLLSDSATLRRRLRFPRVVPAGGLKYEVTFRRRGQVVEILSTGSHGRVSQNRRWHAVLPAGRRR